MKNKAKTLIALTVLPAFFFAGVAEAGRKLASDQYTNITSQMLEDMSVEDIEALLEMKEEELRKAQEAVASGERVEMPEGVAYKLPQTAMVVGAIGSAGSLVSAIHFGGKILKAKSSKGKADKELKLSQEKRAETKTALNTVRAAIRELDGKLDPKSQAAAPAEEVKKLTEERTAKVKERDSLKTTLDEYTRKITTAEREVLGKTADHKVALDKYRGKFKGSAGFAAGFVAVAIGGLAADWAVKRENTVQISEEEKINLELTTNFLANQIEFIKLALNSKEARK